MFGADATMLSSSRLRGQGLQLLAQRIDADLFTSMTKHGIPMVSPGDKPPCAVDKFSKTRD